jgi:hypothetical protein
VNAFERLRVDNIIQGGTRVWWEIARHFTDPGPYEFQLQTGHTGLDDADDWIDVGAPVVDTYMAFDLNKRVYGKTLDVHYRVKLTTSVDVYYSKPQDSDGLLSKRDWITYRELVRKEQLRHRVQTSVRGFLLKARRYGPRCPDCTDTLTEEISNSQCATCYGTGFEFGYFAPLAAHYADVGMESNREHRDPNKGMDKEDKVEARFVGDPQLYSYDVWVNSTSDERYYLQTIGIKAQHRGVPVVLSAELRLAPYTDVIYTVPLEEDPTTPPARPRNEAKKPWKLKNKPSRPGLTYLESAFAELKERQNRSSRRYP